MKIPKRFLYFAVLPLGCFIGYFGYYLSSSRMVFRDADFSFWLILEILMFNLYAIAYLPFSLYLCRGLTVSRFFYVLYFLLIALIHTLYLGVLLHNVWSYVAFEVSKDSHHFSPGLFPDIGIVVGASLVICFFSIVLPATTVFRPKFEKRDQKAE